AGAAQAAGADRGAGFGMKTQAIKVKLRDGEMGAYVAIPDRTPSGAIIAIMEIWLECTQWDLTGPTCIPRKCEFIRLSRPVGSDCVPLQSAISRPPCVPRPGRLPCPRRLYCDRS